MLHKPIAKGYFVFIRENENLTKMSSYAESPARQRCTVTDYKKNVLFDGIIVYLKLIIIIHAKRNGYQRIIKSNKLGFIFMTYHAHGILFAIITCI